MRNLFLFLYSYRAVLFFIFLESVCAWMIVTQNLFISASFFNSSNSTVASVLSSSNLINDYLSLGDINTELTQENAQLRKKILAYEQNLYRLDSRISAKNQLLGQYDFVSAKVINNSTLNVHNHITINKGSKNGVRKGMGVISQHGIIGKVITTSDNFAVVASLLNSDVMISSKIKRIQHLGTINWSGKNVQQANMKFIPRHTNPIVGDTIITSGFNTVFPEGILIGTISELDLGDEDTFYDIKVTLSNDYNMLSYVYVIDNKLKKEQKNVEKEVKNE